MDQSILIKKYPLIFRAVISPRRHKHLPIAHWGIECGQGWYPIIEDLAAWLENEALTLKAAGKRPPIIVQIKEKFGVLTIYVRGFHPDSLDLGTSAWVDIQGEVTDRQVVPQQIDLVFHAFTELYQHHQGFPPLYIITPFKRIKNALIRAISDLERWSDFTLATPTKNGLKDWCKDHRYCPYVPGERK